jgi:hypothetical protein
MASLYQEGVSTDEDENIPLLYSNEYEYRTDQTTTNHDDAHSSSSPTLDLHKIYTSSFVQRAKNNSRRPQSVSSFTTEDGCWSTTSTAQISNTTSFHQQKKQQKRKFLIFTRILMKLLEKRNRNVYHNAQSIIQDCKIKKKNGETDSVVESIKVPLKHVAGEFWYEARRSYYSSKQQQERTMMMTMKRTPVQVSPTSISSSKDTGLFFSQDDSRILHTTTAPSISTNSITKQSSTTIITREESTRKKRLWIIICVFMKYLMKKDEPLYFQAKALVSDCVQRHRNGDKQYRSLSKSIQTRLKNEIGVSYWKRAENYVGKHLLLHTTQQQEQQQEEEDNIIGTITTFNYHEDEYDDDDDDLEPYPIFGPSRKRSNSNNSVIPNPNQKRYKAVR